MSWISITRQHDDVRSPLALPICSRYCMLKKACTVIESDRLTPWLWRLLMTDDANEGERRRKKEDEPEKKFVSLFEVQ